MLRNPTKSNIPQTIIVGGGFIFVSVVSSWVWFSVHSFSVFVYGDRGISVYHNKLCFFFLNLEYQLMKDYVLRRFLVSRYAIICVSSLDVLNERLSRELFWLFSGPVLIIITIIIINWFNLVLEPVWLLWLHYNICSWLRCRLMTTRRPVPGRFSGTHF